jgi:hypothetical protein
MNSLDIEAQEGSDESASGEDSCGHSLIDWQSLYLICFIYIYIYGT